MVYADEAKICRTCGAILESYPKPAIAPKAAPEPEETLLTPADVIEEPPREEAQPAAGSSENLAPWVCPHCKQPVPGNFDVCWNCLSAHDGQTDPGFASIAPAGVTVDQLDADDLDKEGEEKQPDSVTRKRRPCVRCGSHKIVRNVRVLDQGEASDGNLKVVIYGDPGALIFKDRLYGRLSADICGRCGHVELHVENPAELYEHYRRSRH